MAEEIDRPFSWIVNFIGSEGYRENFRVEGATAEDLASRRAATLKVLTALGAGPDVKKLFDGNDTKPGKLDKLAGGSRFQTGKSEEPNVKAARDTGLVAKDTPSEAVTDAPAPTGDASSTPPAISGKLARFAFQPKPQPETPEEVLSADNPPKANVPSKLSKFTARERKSE